MPFTFFDDVTVGQIQVADLFGLLDELCLASAEFAAADFLLFGIGEVPSFDVDLDVDAIMAVCSLCVDLGHDSKLLFLSSQFLFF